jgi:hypothetical protein
MVGILARAIRKESKSSTDGAGTGQVAGLLDEADVYGDAL